MNRGVLTAELVAGRSVVTRAQAGTPLRLLTPGNAGDAAWVFLASHGGGLVDRDGVALDVTVGAGSRLYLSTQASTKVYRSRTWPSRSTPTR